MSNILAQINEDKQKEVDARLGHITADLIAPNAGDTRKPRSLKEALSGSGLSVIAEVKKASPSKGVIRADFQPLKFAKSYEKGGAAALSILTEEKYFQGDPEFLKEIRPQVGLPCLRKDFIVDARQIRESFEMGADVILLIVASLSQEQLTEWHALARSYGLSVLVEVHDEEELAQAIEAKAEIIGVNNRNLKTFEVSLENSLRLVKLMPEGTIKVSESGIATTEDCDILKAAGFDAILVGETLMRAEDPGSHIPKLLGSNIGTT